MYKLPPLVTRPNRRMPHLVNVIELLQLPAYVASRRRERVEEEIRIQYPFSHGDLIERKKGRFVRIDASGIRSVSRTPIPTGFEPLSSQFARHKAAVQVNT